MKYFVRLFILYCIFICTSGCAITHNFGPYYGRVVDSETKEPIEGAAVLAVFYTEEYGPAGSIIRYADAVETITDKNGEFRIDSHRVFVLRPLQGWDPYGYFTIFKPGYGCYPMHEYVKPMFVPNGALPANQFVQVELPRLRTREERLNNIDCFPISVPDKIMKNLIELNNVESLYLGLKPTHKEEN